MVESGETARAVVAAAADAAAEKRRTRGVGRGSLEKRGKKWRGTWTVDGVRYRECFSVETKEEAQTLLDRAMSSYRAQSKRDMLLNVAARIAGHEAEISRAEEARPAMKISEAFEAYRTDPAAPDSGAGTVDHYRAAFDRFEAWIRANHPKVVELRQVTREIAGAFLAYAKSELKVSPNTYNKYVTLYVRMWKILFERARLKVNPWDSVKRLRLEASVRRELTAAEVGKIAATARGEMWVLFAIGIFTGLRLKDAAFLRWEAVDLARNLITVEPSKTRRYSMGRPVAIPIVGQFRGILLRTDPAARRGFVVPAMAALYQRDKGALSNRVQQVFADCGIETQMKVGTRRARVVVGFHSLRHTFVSIAAESGIPFAIVQEIVGHTSPAMTRHYLHVSEKALQEHAAAFPAVFGETANGPALPAPACGDVIDVEAVESAPTACATVQDVCAAVQALDLAGRLKVVAACLRGMSAADLGAVRRLAMEPWKRAKIPRKPGA